MDPPGHDLRRPRPTWTDGTTPEGRYPTRSTSDGVDGHEPSLYGLPADTPQRSYTAQALEHTAYAGDLGGYGKEPVGGYQPYLGGQREVEDGDEPSEATERRSNNREDPPGEKDLRSRLMERVERLERQAQEPRRPQAQKIPATPNSSADRSSSTRTTAISSTATHDLGGRQSAFVPSPRKAPAEGQQSSNPVLSQQRSFDREDPSRGGVTATTTSSGGAPFRSRFVAAAIAAQKASEESGAAASPRVTEPTGGTPMAGTPTAAPPALRSPLDGSPGRRHVKFQDAHPNKLLQSPNQSQLSPQSRGGSPRNPSRGGIRRAGSFGTSTASGISDRSSTAELVAKLASVSRDDPEAALAEIDAILASESRDISGQENGEYVFALQQLLAHRLASQEQDGRHHAQQAHSRVDEDELHSLVDDYEDGVSLDQQSFASTVSSMTAPSFMSTEVTQRQQASNSALLAPRPQPQLMHASQIPFDGDRRAVLAPPKVSRQLPRLAEHDFAGMNFQDNGNDGTKVEFQPFSDPREYQGSSDGWPFKSQSEPGAAVQSSVDVAGVAMRASDIAFRGEGPPNLERAYEDPYARLYDDGERPTTVAKDHLRANGKPSLGDDSDSDQARDVLTAFSRRRERLYDNQALDTDWHVHPSSRRSQSRPLPEALQKMKARFGVGAEAGIESKEVLATQSDVGVSSPAAVTNRTPAPAEVEKETMILKEFEESLKTKDEKKGLFRKSRR